eukprot:TRINITY_DN11762_c0_g1_i1.p1 TRINITY_DN11762_c0_g1~~TRINITY_DN11762_c0_g1_i1.p1  ORF type:complete len:304 (+),score=42.22 TRINITY_DN11762_c0_g1_i1:58-969(+)
MTETKKTVTKEDFSAVWKDGGNKLGGLNLDLVRHLKQQRERPSWISLKNKAISLLKLETYSDRPITVLDAGCGLGIDVVTVALKLGETNKHEGCRVIGLDFNTEMITYAKEVTYAESADAIASNIKVEFIKEDLTSLTSLADNSIDIVRTDIALQHLDLSKALPHIIRVLKPGGRIVSLEGAAIGGLYSPDTIVTSIYNKVLGHLSNNDDGGSGLQLYFLLKSHGFLDVGLELLPSVSNGQDLVAADEGWVKLKAGAQMFVQKGLLTEEESKNYQTHFVKACIDNLVIEVGMAALVTATKPPK